MAAGIEDFLLKSQRQPSRSCVKQGLNLTTTTLVQQATALVADEPVIGELLV